MLESPPFFTLPIFGLIVLGLTVAIFPVFFAFRSPIKPARSFSWGLWFVGLLAFPILTLLIAFLYQMLASAFPQINPYAGSEYESIDAGIFSIFIGLLLALPLTIWLQWFFSKLKT